MFSAGNHRELRASLESIGACVGIFEVNQVEHSYTLVTANTLFEQVVGKALPECIGTKSEVIFERYVDVPLKVSFTDCIQGCIAIEREIVIDDEGSSRWWRFMVSPIVDEEHSVKRLFVTAIEITDKKLLERELKKTSQRFEAVVETAYDGIITVDESHNIKLMNSAAKDIFCIEEEEIIGSSLHTLIPQRYRENHPKYIEGFSESTVKSRPMQARASVVGLRRNGSEFPIEVTISKINVGGKNEMTAVLRDISERARLIEELSRAAIEDHLTKIPNRRCFERDCEKELKRTLRFHRSLSLVVLDIDKFKETNDVFGHKGGDEILKQLAQYIKANIRDIDYVARWGGEEFIVLLSETDLQGAEVWAERVRSMIESKLFTAGDATTSITVSIGIAALSKSMSDYNTLFELADKHLFIAKNSGRNRVVSG